ncbi:hypothetical protein DVK02_04200 [Halobellus sp. Atlit-31R]|nr:hypothetical protein DVK02_04200 [Halobellus sp. Atlit-31R]
MSEHYPTRAGESSPSSHDAETPTEEIATLAEDGHESAAATEETIEEIAIRASEARQSVADLGETIDRISEIVDLIDAVADETNVLALNASIEAARAGDEGDGFAVVADEVKALAQQTHDQTEEIEAFVAAVESDLDQAVETLEHVNESISEAMGQRQGATSKLAEIRRQIDSVQGADTPDSDAQPGDS